MEKNFNFAPYAPPKNILDIINRKRERGLPETITTTVIEQVGIPSSSASRTLRALHFLGLIDEELKQTPIFEEIGNASSSQYPELMKKLVKEAYKDIFTLIDPAIDSMEKIQDAFRRYEPKAQRSRMIALFMKLCSEAKLTNNKATRKSNKSINVTKRFKPLPTFPSNNSENNLAKSDVDQKKNPLSVAEKNLFLALIDQLPTNRQWSKTKRERWIQAVIATVDLLVEVVDD